MTHFARLWYPKIPHSNQEIMNKYNPTESDFISMVSGVRIRFTYLLPLRLSFDASFEAQNSMADDG